MPLIPLTTNLLAHLSREAAAGNIERALLILNEYPETSVHLRQAIVRRSGIVADQSSLDGHPIAALLRGSRWVDLANDQQDLLEKDLASFTTHRKRHLPTTEMLTNRRNRIGRR